MIMPLMIDRYRWCLLYTIGIPSGFPNTARSKHVHVTYTAKPINYDSPEGFRARQILWLNVNNNKLFISISITLGYELR